MGRVPMRYVLGIQRRMPDWPTALDVLWEVHSYAAGKSKNAEFQDPDVRALFGEALDKAVPHLDRYYQDSVFVKSRTSGERVYYKVVASKNPFL